MPWTTTPVTVKPHARLRPVGRFTELVSVSVGPSGEAVVVWTDQDGRAAVHGTSIRPAPVSGMVTVTTADSTQSVPFDRFRARVPVAQPLPDGRVLLVDRWAVWHRSGPDHNAAVYSSDGDLKRTACVGDGISHVRATRDGDIWVGFDDMGIYGNNGWADPGPEPIGAAGLVRFTPDLQIGWEYSALGDGRVAGINDCEVLTLVGDTVWIYPFGEYPLVQIADDTTRVWPAADSHAALRRFGLVVDSRPTGVSALAGSGSQVALAGGYRDRDAGRVVLVDVTGNEWVRRRTVQLVLPDGSRPNPHVVIHGLDDTLHIFQDARWYQVDVAALERAGRPA